MTNVPTNPDAIARLEQTLGRVWNDLRKRHPTQCAVFEATCSNPVQAAMMVLEQGEDYQDLVKQTEAETSVAVLFKTLGPVLLEVFYKLAIPALAG